MGKPGLGNLPKSHEPFPGPWMRLNSHPGPISAHLHSPLWAGGLGGLAGDTGSATTRSARGGSSESSGSTTPAASAPPALLPTFVRCRVALRGDMETNITSLSQ